MGCHSFLQGIFLTQGSNSDLPNCRWILYHLSHQGSPRILEWVAYPFSRGTFWPKNRTGVSCIAGGLFTIWTTVEAPPEYIWYHILICVPTSDLPHPVAPGQRIMSYFPMSAPSLGFPGGSLVKNLPAEKTTWVWSLSWEDPLEEEMATHSCIFARKMPWTEEPGGLWSMGSQRVRQHWVTKRRQQQSQSTPGI